MSSAKKEKLLKLSNEMHGLIAGLLDSPTNTPSRRDTSTTRLLLQRANEAQKKLKRLHTPSSSRSAAVDSSLVSVTVCSMKKTNRGYVKDGMLIEIFVDRDTSYADLVSQLRATLELPQAPPGKSIALFTTGGAVIKNQEVWTLGAYMRQQHRGPGKTRIGIGFIEMVRSGL